MAKKACLPEAARAYVLTLISRLDSAICFYLFRFFFLQKDPGLFENYFCFEKKPPDEDEFNKAIKIAGCSPSEPSEMRLKYPFDMFGTQMAIKFLNKWRETDRFAAFLSREMIVYTNGKKVTLINHLAHVFLLRQELEHPGKKDKDKFIKPDERDGRKISFCLDKSLESLFLLIPEAFMNHVISLLEEREKADEIRKGVNETNRKFRTNLNLRNQKRTRPGLGVGQERFNESKAKAFIGAANLSVLWNMIEAETKKFSPKKKEFFSKKIPMSELFLLFDFVIGIQAVFRRHFCPFAAGKKDAYSGLRDLVSHSHLFFDKGGRPYIDVASEKIKLALEFFDTEYDKVKSADDKSKGQIKTDFMRGLKALCNRKDYVYLEMSVPVTKGGGKTVYNRQTVEVGPPHEKRFSSSDMARAVEARKKKKRENPNLAAAEFKSEKRIFLNLVRQKMKSKIIELEKENKENKRNIS